MVSHAELEGLAYKIIDDQGLETTSTSQQIKNAIGTHYQYRQHDFVGMVQTDYPLLESKMEDMLQRPQDYRIMASWVQHRRLAEMRGKPGLRPTDQEMAQIWESKTQQELLEWYPNLTPVITPRKYSWSELPISVREQLKDIEMEAKQRGY